MEDNIYKNLGKKLLYFRKRAKISQLDLEMSIDTSPGTISRIENGSINPNKETINKIMDVLKLNLTERGYLTGILSLPPSIDEIKKAQVEVMSFFNTKGVLAYLVDDRSNAWAISKDFQKLLGITKYQIDSLIGKNIVNMVLDNSLGINKYINEDSREEMLTNLLSRTYLEMGFMVDDDEFKTILQNIRNDYTADRIWNNILRNGPINIHSKESRTIKFKIASFSVKMIYSVEPLVNNGRFRIVEYIPNNIVLRLLSKI